MTEILQNCLPPDMRELRPLPGIAPLEMADWLQVDDVYGAQMAERARILRDHRAEVLIEMPGARAAAQEALALVLEQLSHRDDFDVGARHVRRPDGVEVVLTGEPLEQLAHLIQEDICLIERPEGAEEHVLTAGLLCFPASWRLAEKVGRGLIGVHEPVEDYDGAMARRVQRLFDGVKEGRPMWRFNRLHYADATLFHPKSEENRRNPVAEEAAGFVRSERQSLVRLPETRAVIFSIHTYLVKA